MNKIFVIQVANPAVIFVSGEDSYSERHTFLCDSLESVSKLIKNWIEKGYDFIGDHEYSFAMNAFEFADEELFKDEGWEIDDGQEEAFRKGILG